MTKLFLTIKATKFKIHKRHMRRFIQFFLVLLLFTNCHADEAEIPQKELVTSDLTGIVLKEGMTLVGKITDAVTGEPIKEIVVSDGYTATTTDDNGVYQIKRKASAIFVHYSIPAEYEVKTDKGSPIFYAKIEKSYDIYRKDFELTRMKDGIENKFTLFCIADPQVRTEKHLDRFRSETMVDLKESAEQFEVSYGMTLGDIVSDAPAMMEPMRRAMADGGMKIFQVIGNHDHNQDEPYDLNAIKNYENTFGPANYSFNRGNAHIVVLDNVIYSGNKKYSGGFTEDQITWLRNDLKYVPDDKLLILGVHIPTRNQNNLVRCQELYALIEPYNEVNIMSGHTHYNQNMKIPESKIYEHIHGAASGAWWSGTINGDGCPNGYGVYEIEGNTIVNWYYKPTGLRKDFQIRMYPIGSFEDSSGDLVANIWNADDDWKVELYEDGVKSGNMIRFTDYEKGAYQFFLGLGKTPPNRENKETTNYFRRPNHLYRFTPRSTDSKIMIKATDGFGNVYTQDEFTTSVDEFREYE